MITEQSRPSSWAVFPTDEDPGTKYKFTSVWLGFSQASMVVERKTYSVLEWLGDLGGLWDALMFIGKVLLPVFTFSAKSELLTSIFYQRLE